MRNETEAPTMKTRRLAAGLYEVDTPKGTFRITDTEGLNGYPRAWMVTWPGERHPDAALDTLREAKATIRYDLEAGS